MAEAPKGGPPSKPEEAGHPEILDLPKYGALYGRFLLASQAQPGEVANILDPNQPTEFNLTTTTLKKRNYNPISENLSFKERQEEWKEAPSFADAYREWKTKFTSFMTKITDPKREFILSMIMHDSKKATDFNETDADRLFNDFCKGKSDVTAFIDRVTASLVNPDSDGKIDPITIQNVLPHIEWIASGLFGKKTASQVVTRLIELESALRNNPEQVIEIFNFDKLGRINMLADDEWEVLGNLHRLIPQAKDVTSKPTVPTTVIPKPDEEKPLTASVQLPEADLEAELAKWKKRLAESRTIPNIVMAQVRIGKLEDQIAAARQTQSPAPPVVPIPEETTPVIPEIKRAGDESPPAPPIASAPEPQPETPHQPVIEEIPIEGSDSVRLKIDGTDLGFELYKLTGRKGDYYLFTFGHKETEYLNIPEGINVYFDTRRTESAPSERIIIIGGKNTRLNIRNLDSLGIADTISIVTPENITDWKLTTTVTAGHEGQAARYDYFSNYDYKKQIGQWMTMEELENYLKTRREEIEKNKIAGENVVTSTGPKPEETATEENIIDVEHINIDNLPEELNKFLSQNKDRSRIVFSFSPNQLKAYMASIAKGFNVGGGDIKVSDDGNEVTMKGLRITKAGIGITLGLAIKSDIINGLTGITASIIEFQRDFLARAIPASSREKVEEQIGQFEDLIMEGLYDQFSGDNSAWKIVNISISNGKFLARFGKTPQTV